jgi:hypothetical protein
MAESVWFWMAMLFGGVIGVLLACLAFEVIRNAKRYPWLNSLRRASAGNARQWPSHAQKAT